jgi:hypothetical protein
VCHSEDALTYVSRPKKTIRERTDKPYMQAIPYAHLQLTYRPLSEQRIRIGKTNLVRATRNPNAKGERKGEMMKPIVQTLS